MTFLVDTSVWSLALRRDIESSAPEVRALHDALLIQLCVRHDLTLLTTDKDFISAAKHTPLRVWQET